MTNFSMSPSVSSKNMQSPVITTLSLVMMKPG